jgi:hypothetical protein
VAAAVKWEWVDPADATRTVTLDLHPATAAKRLFVSGQPIEVPKSSAFATKWRHSFPLGGRTATVTLVLRGFLVPQAELDIDGAVIDARDAPPRPPAWVWLFAVGNLAMLIISKGGAIPGAIAGCAAAACVLATMARTSQLMRLVYCVLITAAAWGTFLALVRAAS